MTRLRPESRHLPLALALCAIAAHAQQGDAAGAGSGGGTFRPRIGLSQSWTDNLRLSDRDKDAALITTVSPGISIVRNTGAVRGSLDYSLNGITYLKTGYGSQLQNALSANLQAEVVPRTFLIDAQASIGQQNASAFGLQAAPTLGSQGAVAALDNPNRRETGSLTVSPLLRGQVGGLASVDLRGNLSITEVRGSGLGDSRGNGGSLRITQLNAGVLGWYMQANTQQLRSKGASSNRNSSATVGLNYRPNPDWLLSANVGQERNDYLSRSGSDEDGFTGGLTADWTPTPRTRVNGNWQRHGYGDSHGLSFEHRMRNSVWRLSDSRTATLGNAGASGGVRTYYDLFFLLYASREPDPVRRDTLVRAELLALGLSPDAQAAVGFLSDGPSELRNQMFSFTLQGVRSNVTASVSRSITSRLGDNLNRGDLANDARIEQRSYSLSASYQLTPVSGLSLTAARQESIGESSSRRTQLTSLMANWNSRLGSRLSVHLGARHSRFEGVTPYSENAVYANLTQQF
ncbi:MAG: TIGR03016 family PEP-CTERM system-associated outer membrane protein [Roseateles sp.]|uniref:TIGR03016 family PEP-CTERM system-associated outer membrane protein n=1 Tax=Roseateles sp. TaxID=1971397 RepID=UPI004035C560